MANQPYRGNYHQGNKLTSQQTTAPGTPATAVVEDKESLTTAEVSRVSAALELGKQQEEQEQEQHFNSLSDEYKDKIIKSVYGVLAGTIKTSEAKQEIGHWFNQLSWQDRAEYRQEFKDIANHVLKQVEDIIQEMPVLLM